MKRAEIGGNFTAVIDRLLEIKQITDPLLKEAKELKSLLSDQEAGYIWGEKGQAQITRPITSRVDTALMKATKWDDGRTVYDAFSRKEESYRITVRKRGKP